MKLFLTIAISMVLFVVGEYIFFPLFGFFEPKIDGIVFQIVDSDRKIKTSLLFSSFLSLMVILVSILWETGRIISPAKRITSIFTILAIIAIAVFMRHSEVKTYFIRVVRPAMLTKEVTSLPYSINPVIFVYYMFGGLIAGLVLSYFLFRTKNIFDSYYSK
jgi:hypothetical protein